MRKGKVNPEKYECALPFALLAWEFIDGAREIESIHSSIHLVVVAVLLHVAMKAAPASSATMYLCANYSGGTYSSYEEAALACRTIVDEFLEGAYKPGMSADELVKLYCLFGEDPWISPTPDDAEHFSGRAYARQCCIELCA